MQNQKGVILSAIAVVTGFVAVIAAAGYFLYEKAELQKEAENKSDQIVCTMDAKMCPDGSYVGRIGPNCDFTECPKTTNETANWPEYQSDEYGFKIKYPANWINLTLTLSSVGRFLFSAPAEQPRSYSFYIAIQENKNKLSSKDFVSELLKENIKQEIGKIKYESGSELTVGGLPAYRLSKVFAYDRNEERIYLASGDKVFLLSFPSAEENPNFQDPITNSALSEKIVTTFQFVSKDNNAALDKEQACLNSGGSISLIDCYCSGTTEFFNNCSVGACTCTPNPSNLRKIKTCQCGEGKCFNGKACVAR